MMRQLPDTEKAKLDFRKRAIMFARDLKEGLSPDDKREIVELREKFERIKKNL